MSRNTQRLRDDAMLVRTSAPGTTVDLVAVDLADTDCVHLALEEASGTLVGTPPECIFFHTAWSGDSEMLERPVKSFQRDLHVRLRLLAVPSRIPREGLRT